MWPESEGNRGANEVATCMFNYIKKQKQKNDIKEIHMFSDNCPGQNKNRIVAFAINYCCNNFNLDKLTHTFLEKGHTETENDAVHATIERKTKRIEIYTPEQWYAAVRAARVSKQPYIVCEMTGADFIDFKKMAAKANNITLDDQGTKVPWSKVVQLSSTGNDPTAIFIKTQYNGESRRLDLNRRKRRIRSGDNITDSRDIQLIKSASRPGVSKAKKSDLISLCNEQQIPSSYRSYFESLPIHGNNSGDDAGGETTEEDQS